MKGWGPFCIRESSTPRRVGWLLAATILVVKPMSGEDAAARPAANARSGSGLAEALLAPAGAAQGANRDLYDGLIGSWDAEVVDILPDGSTRRQSAEMHFAWVLEGRAVQDVWIAPARAERRDTVIGPGNRYGSTLRTYDPSIDAWRITWTNPVTGAETRLVGRRVGTQIVQTGSDAAGRLIRWTFVEVQPDSFRWRGEFSEDGRGSWICDTEFFARRRAEPAIVSASVASHAAWEWIDRPGLETLVLERDVDGNVARGSVLVVLDGAPVQARYRISHDPHWRFLEASVQVGPAQAQRELHVRRQADGHWQVDGTARPDLEHCEDIDLMLTPYTNTPPLAARNLAPGEIRRLRVAWVRFPDLALRAVDQEYTRLEDGDHGQRYRYRNLESGYSAELSVDADRLVLAYGPWKRR